MLMKDGQGRLHHEGNLGVLLPVKDRITIREGERYEDERARYLSNASFGSFGSFRHFSKVWLAPLDVFLSGCGGIMNMLTYC